MSLCDGNNEYAGYESRPGSRERELSEAQVWLDTPKPNVVENSPTDLLDKREFIGRTRLLFNLIPLILQTDSTRVISVIIQDH